MDSFCYFQHISSAKRERNLFRGPKISILKVRSPSRRWRHYTSGGARSIRSPRPRRPLAEILTREVPSRSVACSKCLPRRLKRVFSSYLFNPLERHFLSSLESFCNAFHGWQNTTRRNQHPPGQMRKLPEVEDLFAEGKTYPGI